MLQPLITIMIPTYNQEAYLATAIKSALAQDYPNLAVIIADDCSGDQTPSIVQKFADDGRLKYYRNEKNLGKTANYRRCLYEYAQGDWVLNLDGDDYLIDNHYVSFAMEQIGRYADIVLFTAGVIEAPQQKYRFPHRHRLVNRQTYISGINMFLNWYRYKIPHLTSLYHRETACRIGFYETDILSADWESLLRLVLHGKVILSERIGGVWRKHRVNLSQSLTYSQFIDNFTFITRPYEYALNRGMDKTLLDKWKQKMIKTIMKEQFNETWHKVLSRQNWTEITRFRNAVKKEKPEFLINIFQPKNVVRFSFCFAGMVSQGLRKMIGITARCSVGHK